MDCPRFEDLLRAAESAPEGELARHLSGGCTACEDRLQTARTLLRVLSTTPLAEVPRELHLHAVELGKPAKESPLAQIGSRIREWVATLANPPISGVPAFRGSAAPSQHLYQAGPFEVDVALLADGVLVGQLAAEEDDWDPSGGYCVLYGDGRVETSPLSEDGEFRFQGVTAGSHVLVVRSGDSSVLIPELKIELD